MYAESSGVVDLAANAGLVCWTWEYSVALLSLLNHEQCLINDSERPCGLEDLQLST